VAPIPCSNHFPPLFRSQAGPYVSPFPVLREATPPAPPTTDGELTLTSTGLRQLEQLLNMDFQRGGIYEAADVENMDYQSQLPRKQEDMSITLSQQVEKNGARTPQGIIAPHEMFQDIPDLSQFTWTGWFMSFLEHYGRWCAIAFGTVWLIRLVTWVIGLLTRCTHLEMTDRKRGYEPNNPWARISRAGGNLLAAVMPSISEFMMARYRDLYPPARYSPDAESGNSDKSPSTTTKPCSTWVPTGKEGEWELLPDSLQSPTFGHRTKGFRPIYRPKLTRSSGRVKATSPREMEVGEHLVVRRSEMPELHKMLAITFPSQRDQDEIVIDRSSHPGVYDDCRRSLELLRKEQLEQQRLSKDS